MSEKSFGRHDPSKRDLIKKFAYVAPTVITMSAVASLSSAASGGAAMSSSSMAAMGMSASMGMGMGMMG